MQELILDTSSIVFAAGNGTDVFAAIEEQMPGSAILLSKGVVRELNRISASKSRSGKAAALALQMLRQHKIHVLDDNSYVDSWIVREGSARKCAVCTNDKELKKKLRGAGVRVVSVSAKGILR